MTTTLHTAMHRTSKPICTSGKSHLPDALHLECDNRTTYLLLELGKVCKTPGPLIWQPEVTNAEHPLAQVFNATLAGESWRRQAWVQQGEKLPTFSSSLTPALAEGEAAQLQIKWRLMAACEVGFDVVDAQTAKS